MTGIVVGVDGSDSAARALVWAAHEAELHGWPLRAVLAWDLLDQHHASLAATFDPEYCERSAIEALDEYVAQAFAPSPPPPIVRRTICDLPAAALIEASSDASLLVVGARGLGGFRGVLLGSVSQHCAHHATCPVAIVRGDVTSERQRATARVVVGVDGSATARRALAWAIAEARLRRASLDVVHAWRLPYVDGFPAPVGMVDTDVFAEAAQATVDDALAGLDTSGLPSPIEKIVCIDGAARAILDVAKDADLVVIGSRGRGGFTGLLLGSVSNQVAHHATCPVVIVPAQD